MCQKLKKMAQRRHREGFRQHKDLNYSVGAQVCWPFNKRRGRKFHNSRRAETNQAWQAPVNKTFMAGVPNDGG